MLFDKFFFENRHNNYIFEVTAFVQGLPQHSVLSVANFFVESYGSGIVGVNSCLYAIEPELVESEFKNFRQGLGSIALSPAGFVADEDMGFSSTVDVIDAGKIHIADMRIILA